MWGESSKTCENNCQCSGLITENFTINSGNSATKRRRDEALLTNFKFKMTPHTLNLSPKSPSPPKRRVLGLLQSPLPLQESSISLNNLENIASKFQDISNRLSPKLSPYQSPLSYKCDSKNTYTKATPRKVLGELNTQSPFRSPSNPIPTPKRRVLGEIQNSSLTSPVVKSFGDNSVQSPFKFDGQFNESVNSQRSFRKISKIFEERSKFKMANKENIGEFEEDARDAEFQYGRENWTATKLDFTDVLQSTYKMEEHAFKSDSFVPEKEELDPDFETLHDLEEEFDSDNFDQCSKYEIISTDSPDIISRGRTSSSRKVTSRNFVFGAPLADSEPSTSFNRPANRALNFEDSMFEFPSPAIKKSASSGSVKKSLKFNETPTKDSSPSLKRIFTSESTTSMESGFVSEFEEQFLDMEESNSPKMANFNDLLSGQIKNDVCAVKQPPLYRSKSCNPAQSKARVSLLSILESPHPEKRSQKRSECSEVTTENKRRKCEEETRVRPVLQRAFSENNASIMSALDRSEVIPDLIGDFTQPFALPLTRGNHSDLKSISCDTLAALLRGQTDVTDYQVIDCRYPYEFEGGHISGARNLFTPAQVLALVAGPREPRARRVLVFHCEFSLQRGPKLSRFLRSSDREKNKENYPSLHYPEVYLLHEGYRTFYQRHPDLCSPAGYTSMLDPNHRDQLRQHRSVQQPSSSTHHRRNRLLF